MAVGSCFEIVGDITTGSSSGFNSMIANALLVAVAANWLVSIGLKEGWFCGVTIVITTGGWTTVSVGGGSVGVRFEAGSASTCGWQAEMTRIMKLATGSIMREAKGHV